MKKHINTISISIGVFVHNEEKDIGKTLNALLNQDLGTSFAISEILVFSDACTDNTNNIVNSAARNNKSIKLITSNDRRGKSAAINHFLNIAKEEIVISANGDHIPDKKCLRLLVEALTSDKKIGLAGPQVICVNKDNNLMGYLSKTLWRIHHKVALIQAKAGELIAYKKDIVKRLPYPCVLDESTTEAIVQNAGYNVVYVPDAKVFVKGPQRFRDEIIQRRRNEVGYIHIMHQFLHYRPATFNRKYLLPAIISEISVNPIINIYLAITIFSEIYAKFLAYYDYYILRKTYQSWPVAHSTK